MQVNMTDLSKIVQTNNKTLSVMSFWVKQSSTKREEKSMTLPELNFSFKILVDHES